MQETRKKQNDIVWAFALINEANIREVALLMRTLKGHGRDIFVVSADTPQAALSAFFSEHQPDLLPADRLFGSDTLEEERNVATLRELLTSETRTPYWIGDFNSMDALTEDIYRAGIPVMELSKAEDSDDITIETYLTRVRARLLPQVEQAPQTIQTMEATGGGGGAKSASEDAMPGGAPAATEHTTQHLLFSPASRRPVTHANSDDRDPPEKLRLFPDDDAPQPSQHIHQYDPQLFAPRATAALDALQETPAETLQPQAPGGGVAITVGDGHMSIGAFHHHFHFKAKKDARRDDYWNLPMVDPHFVDRDAVMADIRQFLHAPQPNNIRSLAIVGIAGTGKTACVIATTHQLLSSYQGESSQSSQRSRIIWFRCDDLQKEFSQYAGEFFPSNTATMNNRDLADAVYRHLSQYDRVVMVFDGAHDQESIADFLPRQHMGSTQLCVLITSRAQNWEDIKTLPCSSYQEDEALRFIQQHLPDIRPEESRLLSNGLARHPRSLTAVVRHLKRKQNVGETVDINKLLEDFETAPAGDDAPSLELTLSLTQLSRESHTATKLLEHAALVAYPCTHAMLKQGLAVSNEEYYTALAILLGRSFVQQSEDHCITLSPLIRQKILLTLPQSEKNNMLIEWFTRFAETFDYAFGIPTAVELARHIDRLLTGNGQAVYSRSLLETLVARILVFDQRKKSLRSYVASLSNMALYSQYCVDDDRKALWYLRGAMSALKKLDPQGNDILWVETLQTLVYHYYRQGDLVSANAHFARLAALKRKRAARDAPDDPENLFLTGCLSSSFPIAIQRLTGSLEAYRQTHGLEDSQKAVLAESWFYTRVFFEMGRLATKEGKLEEACKFFSQCIAQRQLALGEYVNTVEIANAYYQMARISQCQGKLQQAQREFNQSNFVRLKLGLPETNRLEPILPEIPAAMLLDEEGFEIFIDPDRLLKNEERDETWERFQEALNTPDNSGETLLRKGKLEPAHFKAYVVLPPEKSFAHFTEVLRRQSIRLLLVDHGRAKYNDIIRIWRETPAAQAGAFRQSIIEGVLSHVKTSAGYPRSPLSADSPSASASPAPIRMNHRSEQLSDTSPTLSTPTAGYQEAAVSLATLLTDEFRDFLSSMTPEDQAVLGTQLVDRTFFHMKCSRFSHQAESGDLLGRKMYVMLHTTPPEEDSGTPGAAARLVTLNLEDSGTENVTFSVETLQCSSLIKLEDERDPRIVSPPATPDRRPPASGFFAHQPESPENLKCMPMRHLSNDGSAECEALAQRYKDSAHPSLNIDEIHFEPPEQKVRDKELLQFYIRQITTTIHERLRVESDQHSGKAAPRNDQLYKILSKILTAFYKQDRHLFTEHKVHLKDSSTVKFLADKLRDTLGTYDYFRESADGVAYALLAPVQNGRETVALVSQSEEGHGLCVHDNIGPFIKALVPSVLMSVWPWIADDTLDSATSVQPSRAPSPFR